MFNFDQHGAIATHRYRSYYDAQSGSQTKCAFCGRYIRYCYVLKDQHGKSFVIGTCDFRQYDGMKVGMQLQAAQLLQESLLQNIHHDQRQQGVWGDVKEHRKAWLAARQGGMRLIRSWRNKKGEWLPKPLYELHIALELKPRQYKLPGCARRWYDNQTQKILHLSKEITTVT